MPRCPRENDSNPVSWVGRFAAARIVERGGRGGDGAVG